MTSPPAADGPPAPARPLGRTGEQTWNDLAPQCDPSDLHLLLLLCEQLDERASLRVTVLQGASPADRRNLRALDGQIATNLAEVRTAIARRLEFQDASEEGSAVDDLASRRAARRAEASTPASAARRSQSRRRGRSG